MSRRIQIMRNNQNAYQENALRGETCPNCRKVHYGQHRCRILCSYCHDLHLKSELIDNLCPVMYPQAKKHQEKHAFQCRNCHGEGSYLEQVTTVRYESNKNYQQKLQKWKELEKDNQQGPSPPPERKVVYRDAQKKQLDCQECSGKGSILRMLECCGEGCTRCRGDKYMINPIWKKYRKEPIINEEEFQCSICLQDVPVATSKYVLQCRHEFHPECISKWIKDTRKCPVCRQHDFYLESEQPFVPSERRRNDIMDIPHMGSISSHNFEMNLEDQFSF